MLASKGLTMFKKFVPRIAKKKKETEKKMHIDNATCKDIRILFTNKNIMV